MDKKTGPSMKPGHTPGSRKTGKTPTKQKVSQQISSVSVNYELLQGPTGSRYGYPPQELLDDLCSRFLLNSPVEELRSFERILFLVESAHWFYEDVARDKDPTLKSFNLREFTALMFQKCAALQPYIGMVDDIYKDFTAYKFQVPTTGAIILNETNDKILLVKGWKPASSWGFPKGKKNKDEEDANCAVREVLEETGLDIAPLVRKEDYLEKVISQQRTRLYIVLGVPENVFCEPRTKKEISEIAWHPVDAMTAGSTAADGSASSHNRGPNGAKYFNVYPFMRPLQDWLAMRGLKRTTPGQHSQGGIIPIFRAKSAPTISSPTSALLPLGTLPAQAPAAAFLSSIPRSIVPLMLADLEAALLPPVTSVSIAPSPPLLPLPASTNLGSTTSTPYTPLTTPLALASAQSTPLLPPRVASLAANLFPEPFSSEPSLHLLPPVTTMAFPSFHLEGAQALPLLTPVPGRHPIGPFGQRAGLGPGQSLRDFRFDTEQILRSLEYVPP